QASPAAGAISRCVCVSSGATGPTAIRASASTPVPPCSGRAGHLESWRRLRGPQSGRSCLHWGGEVSGGRMELNEYIERKRNEHLTDLYEFLRIPSVSAQAEHKQDVQRAAQWVADRMRRVGLDGVEIVATKMHPVVYGESLQAPGKPTILFYGHYDVQPPEPLGLWTSPAFEPTVRDGSLYGRGTADDKGQVHIHLRALDALRQTAGTLP